MDLWHYAAEYVTMMLNMTTILENGTTPYDKLTGRKPDLCTLRPFGEHVAARNLAVRRSTPENGTQRGTFSRGRSIEARVLKRQRDYSAWTVHAINNELVIAGDIFKYTPDGPRTTIIDHDGPIPAAEAGDAVGLQPEDNLDVDPGPLEDALADNEVRRAAAERHEDDDDIVDSLSSFMVFSSFADAEGTPAMVSLEDFERARTNVPT